MNRIRGVNDTSSGGQGSPAARRVLKPGLEYSSIHRPGVSCVEDEGGGYGTGLQFLEYAPTTKTGGPTADDGIQRTERNET